MKPIASGMALAEVVRFLITTLTRWAAARTYGEIRIVVMNGQIEAVHEHMSYRGSVPRRTGPGQETADRVAEQLTVT